MHRKHSLYTSLSTLCCGIFLAALVSPAFAQKAVPPTARQVAASPQYAERLKHPARPASPRHASSPQNILYENGPVNGSEEAAWAVNYGYIVSNTFQLNSDGTVGGFDFYTWSLPGDTLLTVDWAITSEPNGGTLYGSGTALVFETLISNNQYGYNINKETVFLGVPVPLSAGTVWLNLQNAVADTGDVIWWDENSGIGCQSPGCPSEAWESAVGTIPSESFDVTDGSGGGCFSDAAAGKPVRLAHTVTAAPAPTQTFNVIYSFQGKADGANPAVGLSMDGAGILYGTAKLGGVGGGTVFRLIKTTLGWKFNRLYSFGYPYDAWGPNSRVALDSLGSLHGTTLSGGDSFYFGAVFQLLGPERIPPAILGGNWWNEKLLHSFSGGADGVSPSGDLLIDQQGNIYGVTEAGGPSNHGTVYELMGSTKVVLHDFGGAPNDGSAPQAGVISGLGGLYGTTTAGGSCNTGTVYQLGEVEGVIYSFLAENDGAVPLGGLVADSSGNLYGTTRFGGAGGGGTVFMLSYPDWTLTNLYSFTGRASPQASLTMDSSGNLYGTTAAGGAYGQGNVFKLSPSADGWIYTSLHDFSGPDGYRPTGSVLIGADGNLYGTASSGGAYNQGVVWEITP